MVTIWIIVLTVVGTIFFQVILLIVFGWGSDRVQYLDDEVHEYSPEVYDYVNAMFKDMDAMPPESREDYLKNLPDYKEYIDKSPNKSLNSHLKNAIRDEQYELAQHIVDVAKERGFNLETELDESK